MVRVVFNFVYFISDVTLKKIRNADVKWIMVALKMLVVASPPKNDGAFYLFRACVSCVSKVIGLFSVFCWRGRGME